MGKTMNCRTCGSKSLVDFLDLGLQPWCNNFLKKKDLGKEKKYPLVVCFCKDCQIIQLNFTVKKEIMFSDHTYLSGTTKSLSNHFMNVRNNLINQFNITEKKSILDIGSNDGTFLKHFKDIDWDILGVEPAKRISKIAVNNGIKTVNKFFNYELAKNFSKKFDFINAAGVFFHLEELDSVTKGIEYLLTDEGTFIIQFLYTKSIIENTAFDQIYHEHLLYYNLKTLNKYLRQFNLEIFDCYLSEIHGGQMIAYVSKVERKQKSKRYINYLKIENTNKINELDYYQKFSEKVLDVKKKNLDFINKSLSDKKTIFGLGAPAKGNTLLNYFNINAKMIPRLLEINTLRKNLYAPGSHIPIILEKENEKTPDIFYVLAWNFKKEILSKNIDYINKGVEFCFPLEVEG